MANNHGGKRPGAGRKPKDTERALIERLAPYEDQAIEKLIDAMDAGEAWALKLFFEYRWGKPTQRTDITAEGIQVTPISFFSSLPEWIDEPG
jgi:hypothetical protein